MQVDNRAKVLWLIKGLGAGGAERLLALSIEVGDRAAFHYEVAYLLPWKTALVPDLHRVGVPVFCLDGGREWDLRWAIRLRRLLLQRGIGIVHIHSPYVAGVARLVVRSLPAQVRPRLVYTEHLPWSGYVLLTRLLNAFTFSLDDAQLAVSRAVVSSIPAALARRVRVVHQGIVLDRIRQRPAESERMRKELGAGEGDVLFVTVANYREQKAYPDLLAAAKRLLDKGLPVRFVAVGQGPLEREIKEIHRSLHLTDRFLLLGYREDAPAVVAACDAFVLASVTEGVPLAIMEALALGLPVVATSVGGIPEAITDGIEGRLVPPSRPDLLAAAMEELIRDPEGRRRMGRHARERAGDFDIIRAMRETEALYRSIAKGVGGPSKGALPPPIAGQ